MRARYLCPECSQSSLCWQQYIILPPFCLWMLCVCADTQTGGVGMSSVFVCTGAGVFMCHWAKWNGEIHLGFAPGGVAQGENEQRLSCCLCFVQPLWKTSGGGVRVRTGGNVYITYIHYCIVKTSTMGSRPCSQHCINVADREPVNSPECLSPWHVSSREGCLFRGQGREEAWEAQQGVSASRGRFASTR